MEHGLNNRTPYLMRIGMMEQIQTLRRMTEWKIYPIPMWEIWMTRLLDVSIGETRVAKVHRQASEAFSPSGEVLPEEEVQR